ncbi:unnamed protein product [Blepharisma stoltei]|uniref:VWFA domain-containing protein n=1 Tax=Blepharisma stoltei TaxID=1481888 RepID=A0AAU9IPZ3_9CILI|nr:unnamed protein product [Blepharisma stoltei]
MSGSKLTLVKKSMEFMVSQLGPNNRVCLIMFGDSASRVCPLTCTNENGKKILIKKINQIGCVILKSEVQKGLSLALNVLALRRYVNLMT